MTTRMEARVEGLEKAMEEQNRRFEEQFRELRELIINTRGPVVPENRSTGENGAEIQLPLHQNMELPTFDGSDVISWIARAEQYFLVHNTPVERRVQVALIALSGPAMAWIQILLRRSPLITWEDFARELQKRFETSSALNAYEALRATTQEGSLDEYVAAFESRLAQLPELTDQQYLGFFLGGLKPRIRLQIKDPNIASYSDAVQMAKRIDFLDNPSAYTPRSMASPQPRAPSYEQQGSHLAAVISPGTNHSPTERGTAPFTPRGPQPFRRISNEEFQKHVAAGTCFKCGLKFGPTHRCPQKTLQVLVGEDDVETNDMFHDVENVGPKDADLHDPGGRSLLNQP